MSIAKYSSERVFSRRDSITHQAMHIAMSRRYFLKAAAGATALATSASTGFLVPDTAEAQGIGNVLPVPNSLTVFGTDIHVQAPPFTGANTDPATVWNFQGSSAIAFINTTATQINRRTGAVQLNLDSLQNHMTFISGVYRGRDGHVREGTFSLVWIDIFDPQLGGAQIHDFNPGITQNGLFWTAVLSADNVQVDLTAGTATLEAHDLHIKDYGDFENSITGYAGQPVPSVVSFRVQWTASGLVNNINNAAQKFRGLFRNATAQIEYKIRTVDFDITSAPLTDSTTVAAELGYESNGSFY